MLTDQSDYEFIKDKIHVMKESYPSLKNKTDDYVFSALTAKAQFYKNHLHGAIQYTEHYENHRK